MRRIAAALLAICMAICMCSCSQSESEPQVVQALPEKQESVDYGALVEVNLLENGDFHDGDANWSTYLNGGSASVNCSSGKADILISSVGSCDYAVQFFYDGFRLINGGSYTLSFTASASADKWIQPRIQLNGGDYHAYVVDDVLVTSEPQEFTLDFNMTDETDVGPRLAFNMGIFEQDASPLPLTVTISNVSLVLHNQVVQETGDGSAINLNQIGYNPKDVKTAYFRTAELDTADREFRVVSDDGKVAFSGKISDGMTNVSAYEYTYCGDFSALSTPGRYHVETDTLGSSYEFEIGDGVFADAFAATAKMFYLQRCGNELDAKHAGDFAHPACHTSQAKVLNTETYIDANGGWHDAGDYGKYVVPGAKAVADLLLAYRTAPKAFGDNTGIPESSNGVADILDETRYELEWMLKMQREDGAVYHKVTAVKFPAFVMPQEETSALYASEISSPATLDFAAVMAMAAVDYEPIDSGFANRCLAAAKAAYAYDEQHGQKLFRNG